MATHKTAPTPNTGNGSRRYVILVQGLRSSGAAGKHQSKADRRARTRSQALQREIRRERAAG